MNLNQELDAAVLETLTVQLLRTRIAEEIEFPLPAGRPGPTSSGTLGALPEMTESAKTIAKSAFSTSRRVCLAFSGGSDSLVLLDIIAGEGHQPVVVFAESGMEYPETLPFIEKTVARYGLDLRIARPTRTPLEQFQQTGWPMLGKIAARMWMQKNRGRGFKINISECCRAMKIAPARTLARNLGCDTQLTGQRGKADDILRGYRDLQDGPDHFQVRDRIRIVNPLAGWTDAHTRQYLEDRHIEGHPARSRGATTIGCVYCGGGSQYTNSGFRALRSTWPEAWRRFMVEWRGGTIVLALKYGVTAEEVEEAVAGLGGLAALANSRPWVFDFTRRTPIPGYSK